jgi:hypothetical protein
MPRLEEMELHHWVYSPSRNFRFCVEHGEFQERRGDDWITLKAAKA